MTVACVTVNVGAVRVGDIARLPGEGWYRVLKVGKGYYVGWVLHVLALGRGGGGLWGLPHGAKVELRTETGVGR